MLLELNEKEVSLLLAARLPFDLKDKIKFQVGQNKSNPKGIKCEEFDAFVNSLNGTVIQSSKDEKSNIVILLKRHLHLDDFKTLIMFTRRLTYNKYILDIDKLKSSDDNFVYKVNIQKFKNFIDNLNDGTITTFLNKSEFKAFEDELFYKQLPVKKHKMLESIKHLKIDEDIKEYLLAEIKDIVKYNRLPAPDPRGEKFSRDFMRRYRTFKKDQGILLLKKWKEILWY